MLVALLAGCGSADVEVPEFAVTPAGAERCGALLDALPDRVADEPRRAVSGSEYAAAWGDPAIVLRCGVPRPTGFDKGSACLTTNGVDWYAPEQQIDDLGSDIVLTLVKRAPRVEVRMPAAYRPNGPSEAMVDLERTLRRHTEVTGRCR